MILVYDMSGSERLDAVPGEAMTESSGPEMGLPMEGGPFLAPALQEICFEAPKGYSLPLATIDVDALIDRMG
ncbi:hypothetical protein [Endothiovibrio diazotrophicus]